MPKIDIKELFSNMQNQMYQTLEMHRQITDHPVEKGNAIEENWLKWLNTYLPKRYRSDTGFVVDSKGNKSEQIDIIVYDQQYSPFVFNQNKVIYVPAESVYAIFELKTKIGSGEIEYAGKKAASVRTLERTSTSIIHAGGKYLPKELHRIISGILGVESDWTSNLGDAFEKNIFMLEGEAQIDMGCILGEGSFLVNHDNKKIEKCESKDSLIFFFLSFIRDLQKIGTVPALDINEYLKVLEC